MLRFKLEKHACEEGFNRGVCYGYTPFDTDYYVGTLEELEEIGCIDIIKPSSKELDVSHLQMKK